MEIEKVFLGDIKVGDRLRQVDDARIAVIAESMKAIGLQHPITVWTPDNSEVVLVAGAHRLAAAKLLGWEDILCAFVNMDENGRRRWEIAENLHRADLTALQTDEHRAEWIRLTDEDEELKAAQVAPKSKSTANPRGSGRHAGGINAAVKELGIERTAAQRAVKVASLSPTAKAVAREIGLDDNRSALLEAAKHATPDAQVAELRQKAAVRAARAAREHAEVKDTKADAREVLAEAIVEYIPESHLTEITTALAVLGLREVAARIQSLTGAVFDNTVAGRHGVVGRA